MKHWIYLDTSAIINKDLLNKEQLLLYIIVGLSQNFLNQWQVVIQNWDNIG